MPPTPDTKTTLLNQRPAAMRAMTELLVLRIQEGDADASRLLVRLWHGRLRAHARRQTGRDDAADDVVQEAWLGIIRGIRRLRDPGQFPAWAYSIVTRQAALWIRKRQRHRSVERESSITPEPTPPPAQPIGAETDVERLQHAMAALDPAERAMLHLRYDTDLSTDEIAVAMHIPAGTVKSRLFAIRRKLRERMSDDSAH